MVQLMIGTVAMLLVHLKVNRGVFRGYTEYMGD